MFTQSILCSGCSLHYQWKENKLWVKTLGSVTVFFFFLNSVVQVETCVNKLHLL